MIKINLLFAPYYMESLAILCRYYHSILYVIIKLHMYLKVELTDIYEVV